MQEGNYIADIEAIIENGAYHSDEVSETDDEKTQDEVSRHIRPKNKNESDHHVIRVYNTVVPLYSHTPPDYQML